MAKDFRHARFGLVPADFTNQQMEGNEQILTAFLKSYGLSNLHENVDAHSEVFTLAKDYIGNNFRNWLFVNFRFGSGARKELARKIAAFVNGKISAFAVIQQVNMDLGKINYLQAGRQMRDMIMYDGYAPQRNNWKIEEVDFTGIENRHMYDFFAALGPELTAKFCISIDGVYYG